MYFRIVFRSCTRVLHFILLFIFYNLLLLVTLSWQFRDPLSLEQELAHVSYQCHIRLVPRSQCYDSNFRKYLQRCAKDSPILEECITTPPIFPLYLVTSTFSTPFSSIFLAFQLPALTQLNDSSVGIPLLISTMLTSRPPLCEKNGSSCQQSIQLGQTQNELISCMPFCLLPCSEFRSNKLMRRTQAHLVH